MNKKLNLDKYAIWMESKEAPLPDVSFIPPMLRRRMTDIEKIAIYLANQVAPDRDDVFVVFASRYGEWHQTVRLFTQFFESDEMSPAAFSSSVHNAAPGVLSLITHNKNSYTSISAGKNSLATGMLEALISKLPVLFIYAEESVPEIYKTKVDGAVKACGVAALLSDNGQNLTAVNGDVLDEHLLTFDEFIKFLDVGGVLKTSFWKLEYKK